MCDVVIKLGEDAARKPVRIEEILEITVPGAGSLSMCEEITGWSPLALPVSELTAISGAG